VSKIRFIGMLLHERHFYLRPVVFILTAFLGAMIIYSCVNERNPGSLAPTHPSNWMITDSPDFHGRIVSLNGAAGCIHCHGDNLDGGVVNVSCRECHSSLSEVCTRCHGGHYAGDKSGAPPYGLRGEISDTTIAVGAHISHLRGSPQFAKVSCESCHKVPAISLDSAHLDYNPFGTAGAVIVDSIAEINWGSISNKNGNPIWDRQERTCSGTYCHGAFEGGNNENTPIWTAPDQADCGSCHNIGDNPADLAWKHQIHIEVFGLRCIDCHYGVVDSNMAIVDSSLHVNGLIDTIPRNKILCDNCHGAGGSSCIYCHGGVDNETGAPPKGLRGETSSSALAVGAHTIHMEGSNISDGGSCSDCHIVPTSITSSGHFGLDSIAEITWGNQSNLNGGANWDRTAHTCTATYCHGNFNGGKASNSPNWTAVNQALCGSCHDIGSNPSTLTGKHQMHLNRGYACYHCHAATVNSSNIITGLNDHVNGQKNVVFWNGLGSYAPSTKTCSNPGNCHETENWLGGDGNSRGGFGSRGFWRFGGD
jgi:predicted CxxxxCH...CXXCH cytochrome family protein